MSLYSRKTLIRMTMESVYGTFVDPAATEVIWAENLKIEPLAGQVIKDGVMCGHMGADPVIVTGEHVVVDFDFAFRGAGTAGDLPNYDPVLRASGWAATQAADKVTYNPVSSNYESASAVIHMDGNRHPIAGMRGVVTFKGQSKDKMYFSFKGLGLYLPPTATAFVKPDCTAIHTTKPLILNSTGSFTFRGLTPVCYSVSDDFGASVRLEDNLNQKEVELDDRDMSLTVEIKAETVATQDFYTQTLDGTVGPANLVVGSLSGHIVEVDMPQLQFTSGPQYGDREQIKTYSLNSALLPVAGDDEMTIIVR